MALFSRPIDYSPVYFFDNLCSSSVSLFFLFFFSFSGQQWLNALVRSELGLLEFHPTPASSSSSSSSSSPSGAPETTATAKLSRTPHALLLRRETTATVALSTYLKLALQWGNITHAVCGPLLQRAQQIVSSSSPGSANSSGNSSGKSANVNANVDEKLWPAVGDAVLRLEDALTTLKNRQANESHRSEGESDDDEDEDGEGEPIDNFYGNDRSFGAAPHERAAVRMIQVRMVHAFLLRRPKHLTRKHC